MNILHVISSIDPRKGGPTTALAGMAKAQASVGINVTLAATYGPDADHSVAECLNEHGITTRLIGPTRPPFGTHAELTPILRELIERADVAHIHAMWEQIQHRTATVAQQHCTPYIISPHGMLSSWALHRASISKWLKKQLYLMLRMRRVIHRAAAIHYITEFERESSTSLSGPMATIVEPVGISMEEFEHLPEPGTFRKRYAIGDRPLIVFLGRIYPGKGLDYLIPAFAQIESTDCNLAIVGPDVDGHQKHVEALVEQYHLTDRVILTGMLHGQEKIAALSDADLFCLPSDHENFGVVVIEALAAGTPVIISDQVSMHREVKAAGVGCVVDREPSAIANGINHWLKENAKRNETAAHCRQFVRQHYDWGRIARNWSEHYARVLQNASPARSS